MRMKYLPGVVVYPSTWDGNSSDDMWKEQGICVGKSQSLLEESAFTPTAIVMYTMILFDSFTLLLGSMVAGAIALLYLPSRY